MDLTGLSATNDSVENTKYKIVSTGTPYGEVFGHTAAIDYIKELVDNDCSEGADEALDFYNSMLR